MRRPRIELLIACQAGAALMLALAAVASPPAAAASFAAPSPHVRTLVAGPDGLSRSSLDRLAAALGPGGRVAVSRLSAQGRHDAVASAGWGLIDLGQAPTLGFDAVPAEEARLLNALIPNSAMPVEPAPPFRLAGLETPSGKRALRCLTEAVYFEAGRDTDPAQAAVAQVVLNRVRHPAYPSSVCGVVYQGAMRATGCQFSFTCDGSLKLGRLPGAWKQAEGVARRALRGHVAPEVGVSTNYHADYVAPYWAPTVVRVSQVGPHIFYRWTGPLGRRAAFTQRYTGQETNISQAVLESWDWRTQGMEQAVALTNEGGGRGEAAAAVKVLEARGLMAKVEGGRVRALLNPVPRRPTAEEVKAINARMVVIEKGLNPVTPPPLVEEAPAPEDERPG